MTSVQRLPAFNWWKEAIFQGVLTTGILTATSSVQGGPKAKIATFAGRLNQEGFIKRTASAINTAVNPMEILPIILIIVYLLLTKLIIVITLLFN